MKRIVAAALAMMMALTMAYAAAEAEPAKIVPSKAAVDTTDIEEIKSVSGVEMADDWMVVVVEETERMTMEIAEMREAINNMRNNVENSDSVLDLLPETCLEKAVELLGDEFPLNELVVYEYVPVETVNYKDIYGDVDVTFVFATPYVEGMKIVAALGFPLQEVLVDETDFEWTILETFISADEKVIVRFTQEQLLKLEEQSGLLLLISEPMPEPAE